MDTATPAIVSTPEAGSRFRLPSVSDELLARHAGRGSDRAFAAIYERYHQPLYSYVRSIVRHDHDAQDVLQATFANALVALRDRRPRAPLRPWLYRIAHNESISLIRSRKRDAATELADDHGLPAASAEEEAVRRARWTQLTEDLGELSERLRGALLLRELAGLSHEDIAIVLQTSPGAAKQSILEARRALAEFSEGRAMECDEVRRRVSDGDRRVLRGRRVASHLRDCAPCAAFAAAIGTRQADLRAFAPALPATAAAALLTRAVNTGVIHGGAGAGAGAPASGAVSAAGPLSGAAGKAALSASTWKAVTGAVLVVASASAGVAVVRHAIAGHGLRAPAATQPARAAAPRAPRAAATAPAVAGLSAQALLDRKAGLDQAAAVHEHGLGQVGKTGAAPGGRGLGASAVAPGHLRAGRGQSASMGAGAAIHGVAAPGTTHAQGGSSATNGQHTGAAVANHGRSVSSSSPGHVRTTSAAGNQGRYGSGSRGRSAASSSSTSRGGSSSSRGGGHAARSHGNSAGTIGTAVSPAAGVSSAAATSGAGKAVGRGAGTGRTDTTAAAG